MFMWNVKQRTLTEKQKQVFRFVEYFFIIQTLKKKKIHTSTVKNCLRTLNTVVIPHTAKPFMISKNLTNSFRLRDLI